MTSTYTGETANSKIVASGWTSVATYGVLEFHLCFHAKSGSGLLAKVRRIEAESVGRSIVLVSRRLN